jgi:type IV pilus assembly protein PilY1
VDLPETRERVNTDPQLALGTLVVNSNVIETGNVCKVGGSSYANFLDYRSGAPVSTANGVTSVALGNAISTRPALIKLPNNKVISVSRLSDNRTISTLTPVELAVGNTRRLSWRDLIQN